MRSKNSPIPQLFLVCRENRGRQIPCLGMIPRVFQLCFAGEFWIQRRALENGVINHTSVGRTCLDKLAAVSNIIDGTYLRHVDQEDCQFLKQQSKFLHASKKDLSSGKAYPHSDSSYLKHQIDIAVEKFLHSQESL